MEFVIRDAATPDVPALGVIFRRSSLSNVNDRAMLLAHPEVLEFTAAALGRGRVRVAIGAERTVGFVTTIWRADSLELEDLFVDPDWQRQGVGRALIADAVSFAQQQRVGRIEVDGNPHALGFYERLGFTQIGETATQFGVAARMRLVLQG